VRGKARRPAARAFSLVEAAIVLVIVAVLAAIASPRYARAVANYRADAAARAVVRDLTLARQRARSRGAAQTVTFAPDADAYEVVGASSLDGTGAAYRVDLRDGACRARLTSAVFGGDASVVFDGYGCPDSGGSAVVQVGDVQRTVVLDAQTGRASVQ